MDYTVHGILHGQNTGVGNLSFLQGIFPTQRSNPGLLHCRQILYQPRCSCGRLPFPWFHVLLIITEDVRSPCLVPVTAAFVLFSNLLARPLTFLFNVLLLRESEGQKNVSNVPGKTGKRRGRPPKRKKLQEETFMRWENLSVWRSLTQTLMLEGSSRPCSVSGRTWVCPGVLGVPGPAPLKLPAIWEPSAWAVGALTAEGTRNQACPQEVPSRSLRPRFLHRRWRELILWV